MRQNIGKYLMIVMLLGCALFSTAQAADKSPAGIPGAAKTEPVERESHISVSGGVRAGSVNNEVHIRINNNSEKPVTGVTAGIAESPGFVSNIQIEPKKIDLIAPNNAGEFTVHFDISKDAPPGETHRVKFRLSTELGKLEDTGPEVILTVEKEGPEEIRFPVLKLVEIEGPKSRTGYKYNPNSSGYVWEHTIGSSHETTLSVEVTYAPLEITPGEPFRIEAEVRQIVGELLQKKFEEFPPECNRFHKPDRFWRSYDSWDNSDPILSPGISISGNMIIGWTRSKTVLGCGDGILQFTLRFDPEKSEYRTYYPTSDDYNWEFFYTIHPESNGRDTHADPSERSVRLINYWPNRPLSYFYNDSLFKVDVEVRPYNRYTGLAPLILHYRALEGGQKALASLPPFEFSPERPLPSRDATGKAEVAEDNSRKPDMLPGGSRTGDDEGIGTDIATARTIPTPARGGRVAKATPSVTGETPGPAAGGGKPAPPAPVVGIQEVPNVVGLSAREAQERITAAGLLMKPKPGKPASTERDVGRVWTQSPNPGTAMEKGSPIMVTIYGPVEKSSSRQRFKTLVVPDVKGLTASLAGQRITDAGLKPAFRPGGTPKTQKQAGTVERQNPSSGTRTAPGSEVTIFVHGPYVQTITVPNIVGLSLADAKRKLQNTGLELQPTLLGPAPEPGKALQIAGQQPPATTQVETGSSVQVEVYGEYVSTGVTVPDMRGMTLKQAHDALTSGDLMIRPSLIGAAPDASRSQKVNSQKPAAGSKVPPRSMVEVEVWSDYVAPGIGIPDVRGMTLAEAKNFLRNAGLGIKPSLVGPAPDKRKARRIKSQSPPPGTTAAPSTTVNVDLWGDYVPTRDEQVASTDCSKYPGSQAYWDESEGRPMCGCFDGLQWDLSNTKCVPQKVAQNDLCARDFPGSVATGRDSRGVIECNCPQGYEWSSDGTRCVVRTASRKDGDRGSGSTKDCELKIAEIRSFMQAYRNTPNDLPHFKGVAESAAREARFMGCDQGRIEQALGAGRIVSGPDCPPGYTLKETFGQGECVKEQKRGDSRRSLRTCMVNIRYGCDRGNLRGKCYDRFFLQHAKDKIDNWFYITSFSNRASDYEIHNVVLPVRIPNRIGRLVGEYRSEQAAINAAKELCPSGQVKIYVEGVLRE